jgi:hypothetical protein
VAAKAAFKLLALWDRAALVVVVKVLHQVAQVAQELLDRVITVVSVQQVRNMVQAAEVEQAL